MSPWTQHYDPLGSAVLSTIVAVLAILMPAGLALRAAAYGAAYGLFPIGWILLNVLFLRAWRPSLTEERADRGAIVRAWTPWAILTIVVFAWGTPQVKGWLNGISAPALPVPGLHEMVMRIAPVVVEPKAEAAVFTFNWSSATGSGIAIAALLGGLVMGCTPRIMARTYAMNARRLVPSLFTISAWTPRSWPRPTARAA